MKYYLDLTLLPDDGVSTFFLWEKVYPQLHLALVEQLDDKKGKIGVAFPQYHVNEHTKHIGRKARLFAAEKQQLVDLNVSNKLERLLDYVHVTSIREVPENISEYARYSRVHGQASKEQLARRKVVRVKKKEGKDISYEEALAHYKNYGRLNTNLPCVFIKSMTNGTRFPLLIKQDVIGIGTFDPAQNITFDSYGLSKEGYLPHF